MNTNTRQNGRRFNLTRTTKKNNFTINGIYPTINDSYLRWSLRMSMLSLIHMLRIINTSTTISTISKPLSNTTPSWTIFLLTSSTCSTKTREYKASKKCSKVTAWYSTTNSKILQCLWRRNLDKTGQRVPIVIKKIAEDPDF